MRIVDCDQRSDAWYAARCGIPTASLASKILTPTGKLSAQSNKLLDTLLTERAGQMAEPIEPTEWMQRGIALEEDARNYFALLLDEGLSLCEVGFVTNDAGTAGCSPDAIIYRGRWRSNISPRRLAGLEIKCPKADTHAGYVRAGVLPAAYLPQVHMSMAITGVRKWWFMSYFPPAENTRDCVLLEPFITCAVWNDYTEEVAEALDQFCSTLERESRKYVRQAA